MWPFSSSWQAIRDQKQEARAAAVARTQKTLSLDDTSPDAAFVDATALKITKKIESGEWTASRVLEAFIRRAIQAQEHTNCLTEILFEQARQEAIELDNEFALTKCLRGPLHGVPVSFKDQFDVAGTDSTIGFTQWANKPSTSNAQLVTQFRAAGALIIAKTNVPQTMMSFECSNPLWGRSTNPWSAAHTCGGSSGGEGALLAMSGSALGVGSDIGGSLRIPAGYCGVYSLKPGFGRLSSRGAKGAYPGFEGVRSVMGPMARSIDDVELMCRTCFGAPGLEADDIPPVPYRDSILPPKLKLGYYVADGFIKASPASQRAVTETVEALQNAGHECVRIDVTAFTAAALRIFVGLTSADGFKTLLSHIGPDPTESSLFLPTLGPRLFSFVRNFVVWAVKNIVGDTIFGSTMGESREKSVAEFVQFADKRNKLRQLWYEEIWIKYGLDGIIAPLQASPAITHKASIQLSPMAAATILYNVIDSPVGVVPVTRVDAGKDQLTEAWAKAPGSGSKLLEDGLYKGKKPVYDPKAMHGLPLGVQVVGKSWEDEKVISMMRIVDAALGPRGFGPSAWSERKAT